MEIKSHHDLVVWQRAMDLIEGVYGLARHLPRDEQYGLISQLKRAAVSIATNIAEGRARSSRKDFSSFLHISKGSLMEVEILIQVALRLRYATKPQTAKPLALIDETGRMLSSMLARLQQPRSSPEARS